ncbi:MAG: cell division protein FtsZ [Chitinophagaceae bacterium]
MKSNIIKVLGFGGGGSNAVNHMYKQQISNVDFIICNTDAQSLATSDVPIKIQLGPHLTQGLGAGANPAVGKQATEESLEEIRRMLEINTKMAFITAGMGGGTGTGGAPAIAKVCREMGILTVGIVTTPFGFEGPKRMKHAQEGIEELKKHVDTLLVINNDKLRQQYGNLKMKEAFSKADDVLATAARCITDIINSIGQINVDFADVCTVMRDGGVAILGNATAKGEGRALRAIEEAINSPLLNDNDIRGAKWILINITSAEGDHEYTMDEVDAIQEYVRSQTGEDSDVILGIGYDTNLTDELGVTIIATGFGHKDPFMPPPPPKKEVVVVKKEIIGVLFEDAPSKSDAQPEMTTLPVENANPLAPTLMENVPAPNIVEPIQQTEDVEPVFMMLGDAKAPITPVDEAVMDISVMEQIPMELNFILNEQDPMTVSVGDTIHEEPPANTSGLLSRPANIYVTPPPVFVAEKLEEKLFPVIEATPLQQFIFEIKEEVVAEVKAEIKDEEQEVKEMKKNFFTGEENFDMGMVIKEEVEPMKMEVKPVAAVPPVQEDMSEDEEQKRRAQERVDKIKKLRNLSFNFNAADPNNEFEQVPAYMRREMDLHNSIANVENFYSRATVKTDENDQGSISTINTFLDGKQPD